MQDKDFDRLFSSKFEDFEAEPSPMVWENIAGELDGKKAALPWMSYLSIAAAIAILFTAGWLFMKNGVASGDKHHNYANLVNHDSIKPQVTPAVKQPEPSVTDKALANKAEAERIASNNNHQHKTISPVNKVAEPVDNKTDDMIKDPQQQVNSDQQLIAQVTAPATVPGKPIMPDVQLSPKTIETVAATPVEKPVVITTEKETEEAPRKRGIHNLGGLINALVSKVDKRPHKFIEFSDDADDDAETNLTAVNMGPLKFKKQ